MPLYPYHALWPLPLGFLPTSAGGFNFGDFGDKFGKGLRSLLNTLGAVLLFAVVLFGISLWKPLLALLIRLVSRPLPHISFFVFYSMERASMANGSGVVLLDLGGP